MTGVATTLPFFRWLMGQPAFVSGGFDTTSLDTILAERREPFVEPSSVDARDAAVVAAIAAWRLRATGGGPVEPPSRWRRAGRQEGMQ